LLLRCLLRLLLLLGLGLSGGSPGRSAIDGAWRAKSAPGMRRTYPYPYPHANADANARVAAV
jgi:hypothetical protein